MSSNGTKDAGVSDPGKVGIVLRQAAVLTGIGLALGLSWRGEPPPSNRSTRSARTNVKASRPRDLLCVAAGHDPAGESSQETRRSREPEVRNVKAS
jgi:hypothetical protein